MMFQDSIILQVISFVVFVFFVVALGISLIHKEEFDEQVTDPQVARIILLVLVAATLRGAF